MVFGTFWHKRYLLIIAVILSLFATYALCNISVQEKWKTRLSLAKTEAQLEYATADGANLVFTAFFIGPFEALLYTFFWGLLGWKIWPRLRKTKMRRT